MADGSMGGRRENHMTGKRERDEEGGGELSTVLTALLRTKRNEKERQTNCNRYSSDDSLLYPR